MRLVKFSVEDCQLFFSVSFRRLTRCKHLILLFPFDHLEVGADEAAVSGHLGEMVAERDVELDYVDWVPAPDV